ncbi:MAG TPA: DUF4214 domain-containing protein [Pyrinomonadaceae bacterium]|jgi:YD repeat-containing protein|nr:DUF4214 domain-containing protein [Pyrinomonadaceae bacterium]
MRTLYGTKTLLDSTGREADSYQFFDGLGRPARDMSYENQDPNNPWLTVDTQYDGIGRTLRVSLPYRSSACTSIVNPSSRWTQTNFDALARPKEMVTTADGAKVTFSYGGNTVTVTDQAGRKRRTVTDAFGNLVQVDEPNKDSGSLDNGGTFTSYKYDVLGKLRKVTQGGQERFFLYDSLGRLLRAKNPEQTANSLISNMTDATTNNNQWSTAYVYDNNGNLTTRTDARSVTTTYAYDSLNRVKTVRYSDGTKDIDRHFDGAVNGKGRFWYANWDPNGNTRFDTMMAIDQYDAVGRPLNCRQHFYTNGVASAPFNVTRIYDKVGHVTNQTYPSGHTASFGYDIAARINSDVGNLGDGVARTYSTAITYSQFGGLEQEQYGTQTSLYHKLHYNVRGQVYDIRLSTVPWSGDQGNWNRGALLNWYDSTTGFQYQNPNSALDNNGNATRQEIFIPNDDQISGYSWMRQNYSYDSLNRLTSISELQNGTTASFTQIYEYDRWGNRTVNPSSSISNTQFDQADAQNTNRLYAPGDTAIPTMTQRRIQYDNAGNQVYDSYTGQGARTYDAENRMTANSQVQTYTYDAGGRRIKRNVNGVATWQVYGIGGELLAEYKAGTAPFLPSKEYGYRGSELLVTMASGDDARLARFVTNLYYGAKQADPTPQQLQDAVNQLAAAGATSQTQLLTVASQIARGLFTGTNYETNAPVRTDAQYVGDLYYAYLQRGPDDSGLGWWTGQVATNGRANVCNAFEASAEFITLVSALYGTATSTTNVPNTSSTTFIWEREEQMPRRPSCRRSATR